MSAFAAGIISLIFYLITLSPAIRFWDSAELTAAASVLGIAHSPGFPLYSIVGRLFVIPGICSPAIAVNILSALSAAVAVFLVPLIYREINSGARLPGALIAAGLTAFGGRLWMQAVRAEVYAPSFLLLVIALYLAARYGKSGERRYFFTAVYVWGLGTAIHTAMSAAFLPPIIWLAFCGSRIKKMGVTSWLIAAALPILAATVYLYIPIRGSLDPAVDWGDVSSLRELWWMMSSREFAFTVSFGKWEDFIARLVLFWKLFYANFPLFLIFMGLAGIFLVKKKTPMILLFVFGSVISLIREELPHPDHLGYLLPAVLAGSIWTGAAFDRITGLLERQKWIDLGSASRNIIITALLVFLLFPLTLVQYRNNNFSAGAWAEKMGRGILEPLPENSIVLMSDISSFFICRCLQVVDGIRPDCAVILPGLLSADSKSRDWYHRELLKKKTIAGLEGNLPSAEEAITARIVEANHLNRSVFCEYGKHFRAFAPYLYPAGLVFRMSLPGDSTSTAAYEYEFPLKREFGDDRGAALAFAARLYSLGLYYSDIGDIDRAKETFYRAKLTAGNPEELSGTVEPLFR